MFLGAFTNRAIGRRLPQLVAKLVVFHPVHLLSVRVRIGDWGYHRRWIWDNGSCIYFYFLENLEMKK